MGEKAAHQTATRAATAGAPGYGAAFDGAAAVFCGGTGKAASREAEVSELYAKIGQLTVERDFLSRRSGRWPGSSASR